jgi:hypothetical protein
MMKRNKEVRRIEGRPNAENSARESERNLWPCLCRVLSGMQFWFLFVNLSQFHPSRPRSKFISSNRLFVAPFTPDFIRQCYPWKYYSPVTTLMTKSRYALWAHTN